MKKIQLTKGYETLVDSDDYEWLSSFRWHAVVARSRYVYARTNIDGVSVRMSRLILGLNPSDKKVADHIDGNTLNNQRKNLRICTQQQNTHNSKSQRKSLSPYKGVSRLKEGLWCVKVCCEGINHHIGTFKNDVLGAVHYNIHARRLHGEHARLNQIKNEKEILDVLSEIESLKRKLDALCTEAPQ